MPFDIPDNWTWIRFPNLVNFYLGKTPERHNDSYWNNGKYPWFSIADMKDKEIIYNSKEKISELSFKENFSSKLSPAGTLIMSFKLTVGRVSILGVDALHNEAIISILPYLSKDGSIKKWLFYTLGILVTYVEQTGAIKGNTLNKDKMSNMYIPLPPLEEQQRIVDKINSFEPLLEKYDIIEKELSKLEKEFPEKLKKSILQYAIEGKLVKQDPNDEPASVLLERIKQEKERLIKEGKIKRDKNESYIYQGDDKNYYENVVNKWVVSRLIDVGFITGGGTPKTEINNYWDGNIVWITPADLAKKSKIISYSKRKITNLGLSKSSATIINKNSIIMSSRAPIGYISINAIDLCTSQGCKSFTRYSQNILNIEYVYYYLNAIVEELQKRGSGTTFKEISGKEFGLTLIIIPPLNEQLRIVNKIELINRVID